MNGIKTKHRSRLIDDNLALCLRIALTTYEPNYEELRKLSLFDTIICIVDPKASIRQKSPLSLFSGEDSFGPGVILVDLRSKSAKS